jgi:tetratricopeptide (TPR) repeat protein
VGDRLGEANVLQAMGDVQQFRDDREAALASYEQALTLYRQVGAKLGEANVRKAMGDVQQFRDDQEAVLASYEQALILYRQVGDRLGEANCYLAQGRVALVQEDYQKALTLHTSAYQLYQQIQDRYSQVRSLYYRSFVYAAMNETSLAIQDMENALITARAFGLPFVELLEQRYDSLHENVE